MIKTRSRVAPCVDAYNRLGSESTPAILLYTCMNEIDQGRHLSRKPIPKPQTPPDARWGKVTLPRGRVKLDTKVKFDLNFRLSSEKYFQKG